MISMHQLLHHKENTLRDRPEFIIVKAIYTVQAPRVC